MELEPTELAFKASSWLPRSHSTKPSCPNARLPSHSAIVGICWIETTSTGIPTTQLWNHIQKGLYCLHGYCFTGCEYHRKIISWLMVSTYPTEKYEFVSWDDEIHNIWKNKKMFQATNQLVFQPVQFTVRVLLVNHWVIILEQTIPLHIPVITMAMEH